MVQVCEVCCADRRSELMPPRKPKPWESCQAVAVELLNQFAAHFQLQRVEGDQKVHGKVGVWRIDAKGVREFDGATILVECRRKGRRLNQEMLGAIAYRIGDIEAKGGIVVSPLDLQVGAKRIATAEKIVAVQLDASSTPTDFAMRFFGKLMVGASIDADATAGAVFDAVTSVRESIRADAVVGDTTDATAFAALLVLRQGIPASRLRSTTLSAMREGYSDRALIRRRAG